MMIRKTAAYAVAIVIGLSSFVDVRAGELLIKEAKCELSRFLTEFMYSDISRLASIHGMERTKYLVAKRLYEKDAIFLEHLRSIDENYISDGNVKVEQTLLNSYDLRSFPNILAIQQDWAARTGSYRYTKTVPALCEFTAEINGTIDQKLASDFKEFVTVVKPNFANTLHLSINSRGGDVTSAIQIGREIRKHLLDLLVDQEQVCYSSCTLVLAGAVRRFTFSKNIGMHRLYPSAAMISSSRRPDLDRAYNQILSDAVAYLREMRVPEALVTDYLSVPSDHIKLMDADELMRLRLVGRDPLFHEMEKAHERDLAGNPIGIFGQISSNVDSYLGSTGVLAREKQLSSGMFLLTAIETYIPYVRRHGSATVWLSNPGAGR